MGSLLRTTPVGILALTAALAFLAACGTAASPAGSTGTSPGNGSRHGSGASPGTVLAAGEDQAPVAGTGNGRAAIPPRTAAPDGGGTTVPDAPNCPMFPADNVWNTDISQLPVNAHSAAWMRSMDSASIDLHPDFGPNTGGFPFGIPDNIVTSAQPLVPVRFQYATESDKGPYPFGPPRRPPSRLTSGRPGTRQAQARTRRCRRWVPGSGSARASTSPGSAPVPCRTARTPRLS